jgi:hypothetical protein
MAARFEDVRLAGAAADAPSAAIALDTGDIVQAR